MMCSAAWPVGLDREICVPSFWGQPRKDPMQIAKLQLVAATSIQSSSGVAQWLACWAHNPKVRGSKPRSANFAMPVWIPCGCVASACARLTFVARTARAVRVQAAGALAGCFGSKLASPNSISRVRRASSHCLQQARRTKLLSDGGHSVLSDSAARTRCGTYAQTMRRGHRSKNFRRVLAKHLWSSGYDVSPTR